VFVQNLIAMRHWCGVYWQREDGKIRAF